MDKQEARDILAKELARYRAQSYEQLQRLLKTPDTCEPQGPSGTTYQLEIYAFWDSRRGGDLRVVGAIDDGGWSAFKPLCEAFILSPDGRFVGEASVQASVRPTSVGNQGWLSLGLGLLVIFAGLVQAGMDEEFLPRFHFPLVTVAFGIPPVVLGILAIRGSGCRTRGPFLLRHAGAVSAAFLAAALVFQGHLEGVVSEERFDMTWSLSTYKLWKHDRIGVRLEFVDHPGWVTEVQSKDLADHLTTLGSGRVPVVFRVIRDFGRLREFKVIQVADRRDWKYNDRGGWTGGFGWMLAPTATREGLGPPPIR